MDEKREERLERLERDRDRVEEEKSAANWLWARHTRESISTWNRLSENVKILFRHTDTPQQRGKVPYSLILFSCTPSCHFSLSFSIVYSTTILSILSILLLPGELKLHFINPFDIPARRENHQEIIQVYKWTGKRDDQKKETKRK